MEKIVKYIAFDGTEFDDDCECIQYELDLQVQQAGNELRMYDQDRNPTDDPELCYYLFCATDNAAKVFMNLADSFGIFVPEEWDGDSKTPTAGAWVWQHSTWVGYDLIRDHLMEEIERLDRMFAEVK